MSETMPRPRQNRNSLVALVILLVALLAAFYFFPPDPLPDDPAPPEPRFLAGMTSADLFRLHNRYSQDALSPSDKEKAASILAECESLWTELQKIKNDPEFRKQRFSEGSRFAVWRERAERLHGNRPDKEIVGSDIHRLPGALLGVANDYAGTLDLPSSQEEWFENFYLPMARKSVQPQD